jgi:hypothetical protein
MAVGALAKSDGKNYPGNMTVFVFLACLVASSGGLIFGYDIGISGEFSRRAIGRSVPLHETASETD